MDINKTMKEIIEYLRKQINGLDNLKKISEQKNVEQTVFYNLGAIDAFREILWKINQYDQDEIKALDQIIEEIKTLEFYFSKIKKDEYFAKDWEVKRIIKYRCEKLSFLCEKLLRQIGEKNNG